MRRGWSTEMVGEKGRHKKGRHKKGRHKKGRHKKDRGPGKLAHYIARKPEASSGVWSRRVRRG